MSVMRVHSTRVDKPHFPWLYGPVAATAMQQALNLRYALLPYYYSLAHQFSQTGIPYVQSLVMAYPADPSTHAITTPWMLGDLMAAPVVLPLDRSEVYFPTDLWYSFNSSATLQGPRAVVLNVSLLDIPLFVRAGSLVSLAPALQYSDQLPGGPLSLHIYSGKDASFVLTEDDGETLSYQQGAVRTVHFQWAESTHTLSWTASSGPLDGHGFVSVVAVLFNAQGRVPSTETVIGLSGSITF